MIDVENLTEAWQLRRLIQDVKSNNIERAHKMFGINPLQREEKYSSKSDLSDMNASKKLLHKLDDTVESKVKG